ncbi:MAG TPA: patatin-like phospholipase family protein [Candidatus Limnocylindrales bacterium]|nr:patatin-like phospholipase family protein [Candidatus Limnocylindrales bacterium]
MSQHDGTALVLGGGGITGAAWEIGLLAGLAEAGVDLTSADLVVGTSAGSVAGAQIRSGTPIEDLYARQLEPPAAEIPARLNARAMLRFLLPLLWPGDERGNRARLGRAALRARTMSETERRAVIASRLPNPSWPERRLLITAVDAETGEVRVFDRDAGVALVDAVAASCAVPFVYPAMSIDGRRYVDGGVRSVANADLAKDCRRVVVMVPTVFALRRTQRIANQLATLGEGVQSIVVSPDAEARKAMGTQALDPAFRAPSARAGRSQAGRVAGAVGAVWPRTGGAT